MSLLRIITKPFEWLGIGLIYFYKYCISPLLPHGCIYQPSCSTYTLICVRRFGIIKGTWLGVKRVFRCTPKHKGGLDVPPDNIKGDAKWLV